MGITHKQVYLSLSDDAIAIVTITDLSAPQIIGRIDSPSELHGRGVLYSAGQSVYMSSRDRIYLWSYVGGRFRMSGIYSAQELYPPESAEELEEGLSIAAIAEKGDEVVALFKNGMLVLWDKESGFVKAAL